MSNVKFQEENCKGCGLCVSVCPKNLISISHNMNSNGYRIALVEEMESCIGCGFCAKMCPDSVITVQKG